MRANSFIIKQAPVLIDLRAVVNLVVKQKLQIQYKNTY